MLTGGKVLKTIMPLQFPFILQDCTQQDIILIYNCITSFAQWQISNMIITVETVLHTIGFNTTVLMYWWWRWQSIFYMFTIVLRNSTIWSVFLNQMMIQFVGTLNSLNHDVMGSENVEVHNWVEHWMWSCVLMVLMMLCTYVF